MYDFFRALAWICALTLYPLLIVIAVLFALGSGGDALRVLGLTLAFQIAALVFNQFAWWSMTPLQRDIHRMVQSLGTRRR